MSIKPFFTVMLFISQCWSPLIYATDTTPSSTKHSLHIETFKTEKGTPVYFVATHEIPILDIQIVFNAGSARDAEHFGLANITSNMLNDGTNKHTEEQIAEIFDALGTEFGEEVGRDRSIVGLRSLVKPDVFNPALDLFIEILTSTNFPNEAFLREQKNALSDIKQAEEDPTNVAANAFFSALYKEHPYAHPPVGTQETVQKLNAADLKKFYQRYYVANNAIIALVGDISRTDAERIANKITAKMAKGEPAAALTIPTPTTSRMIPINFPTKQSTILIGGLGVNRDDPRYFPLMVGNMILGGDPWISMLFKNIRETRGLAYTVNSSFIPMQALGSFIIFMQTRSDQAQEAIAVTMKTLHDFLEKPIDPTALINAKKSITGAFPLRLDSNSSIISNIAMIGFYHLPLTYLDDYNAKVNAVTAGDIHSAFEKTIDFKELITTTVGNLEVKKANK